MQAARAARPASRVSDAALAAFIEDRLARGELTEDAALRNASDLMLACGALAGDLESIAELEAELIEPLAPVIVRIVGDAGVDEVKQRVRATLLVAEPGATPRLAGYAGRGPLRAWVRAVAVRVALRVRGDASGEELASDILGDQADPALQLFHRKYAGELRASFEAALGTLSSRERRLLRQQFVDGLGTEALAALHNVHRVTMFRQLGKIRTRLVAETRRQLARRIQLERAELDSIMAAVHGNVELTLERVLASELP